MHEAGLPLLTAKGCSDLLTIHSDGARISGPTEVVWSKTERLPILLKWVTLVSHARPN